MSKLVASAPFSDAVATSALAADTDIWIRPTFTLGRRVVEEPAAVCIHRATDVAFGSKCEMLRASRCFPLRLRLC